MRLASGRRIPERLGISEAPGVNQRPVPRGTRQRHYPGTEMEYRAKRREVVDAHAIVGESAMLRRVWHRLLSRPKLEPVEPGAPPRSGIIMTMTQPKALEQPVSNPGDALMTFDPFKHEDKKLAFLMALFEIEGEADGKPMHETHHERTVGARAGLTVEESSELADELFEEESIEATAVNGLVCSLTPKGKRQVEMAEYNDTFIAKWRKFKGMLASGAKTLASGAAKIAGQAAGEVIKNQVR